ncbi:hypothetical protein CEUSTIGMA_g1604.t1 [Chlamydomonas eustigma]|uniref:GCK domain-containing protein n=1 Tax=Chlamydomonas eustigma TaxID=1157962 RepID=A0A250WTL7_9CHLO|nr:hypothetical protein CEUSTIGMA_g1604.t1 [Chlamydomonas eustigma]|eukprot:GAX74155.1 hypothetical protein CEUSTIGMA_g1604.t1 [Chlamydomonas eustigma]
MNALNSATPVAIQLHALRGTFSPIGKIKVLFMSEHKIEDNSGKEECGWCKWMKAGGCAAEFTAWLDCVDAVRDAGREDVETCASVMSPLWACMEKHADYYAPQVGALRASKNDEGDNHSPETAASEQQQGNQEGVTKSVTTEAEYIDIDLMTDKDVEKNLDRIDAEEAKGKKS